MSDKPTYTIEKCDGGRPLPPDSMGTWYTWDVRENGRSISQHRKRSEAERARELLLEKPGFRSLLEAFKKGTRDDINLLDALADAYDAGFVDGQRHMIDGGGP